MSLVDEIQLTKIKYGILLMYFMVGLKCEAFLLVKFS